MTTLGASQNGFFVLVLRTLMKYNTGHNKWGSKIQRASRELPLVTIFSPNPSRVAKCETPKRNMPLPQPSQPGFPLLLSCSAFPWRFSPYCTEHHWLVHTISHCYFQFLARLYHGKFFPSCSQNLDKAEHYRLPPMSSSRSRVSPVFI